MDQIKSNYVILHCYTVPSYQTVPKKKKIKLEIFQIARSCARFLMQELGHILRAPARFEQETMQEFQSYFLDVALSCMTILINMQDALLILVDVVDIILWVCPVGVVSTPEAGAC